MRTGGVAEQEMFCNGWILNENGAVLRLILVFNKTVKNRFIRLLFQQPAA